MADVKERDEKERKLARDISREFRRFLGVLLDVIPELSEYATDVDVRLWNEHRTKLVGAIQPHLEDLYADHAEMLRVQVFGGKSVKIDWDMIHIGAIDWAKEKAGELVKGITKTSQSILRSLIPAYFQHQWTQGELTQRVSKYLGPERAKMIARTEVTNAASGGEQAMAAMLADQGVVMQPVWQTRADEIVCEVYAGGMGCGPRNGKKIGVDIPDEYPALHPNCRCWLSYEYVSS